VEFNSFGPAVGRLGSDSSRGGANSAKVEAGGLSPPSPLTLTTGPTLLASRGHAAVSSAGEMSICVDVVDAADLRSCAYDTRAWAPACLSVGRRIPRDNDTQLNVAVPSRSVAQRRGRRQMLLTLSVCLLHHSDAGTTTPHPPVTSAAVSECAAPVTAAIEIRPVSVSCEQAPEIEPADQQQPYSYLLTTTFAVQVELGTVARFSTTKYGIFVSVDPSKSSPPNVSIYNSVPVAIRTQLPHKQ